MNTFEGNLVSQNMKVGIVCARFNEFIVSKLLSGCLDTLLRHGVQEHDISVAWVPGAFEIPLIAANCASGIEQRDPRHVWRTDHRHHRAGD